MTNTTTGRRAVVRTVSGIWRRARSPLALLIVTAVFACLIYLLAALPSHPLVLLLGMGMVVVTSAVAGWAMNVLADRWSR